MPPWRYSVVHSANTFVQYKKSLIYLFSLYRIKKIREKKKILRDKKSMLGHAGSRTNAIGSC
jgi:hypothetical protein